MPFWCVFCKALRSMWYTLIARPPCLPCTPCRSWKHELKYIGLRQSQPNKTIVVSESQRSQLSLSLKSLPHTPTMFAASSISSHNYITQALVLQAVQMLSETRNCLLSSKTRQVYRPCYKHRISSRTVALLDELIQQVKETKVVRPEH